MVSSKKISSNKFSTFLTFKQKFEKKCFSSNYFFSSIDFLSLIFSTTNTSLSWKLAWKAWKPKFPIFWGELHIFSAYKLHLDLEFHCWKLDWKSTKLTDTHFSLGGEGFSYDLRLCTVCCRLLSPLLTYS